MKKLLAVWMIILPFFVAALAQQQANTNQETKKQRAPIFRATKEQIVEAQRKLQVPETGRMDEATRAAIRKYQTENGLKPTGTLNRATLEKMGIQLTEKQQQIPVNPEHLASTKSEGKKRSGPIFRANKEQIERAQEILKSGGYYGGEKTGRLDKDTREAIKKYQEANGLKKTGTLNAETLQKMGIELTEKQKEILQKRSSP
ncbi:MAG: peptidoglycan-binding protein [Pyrinomonadaceae bacterium]|nr:peptidoglycan-binding protein [Pyrinomonadaceae bacterium]MCX7639984.1 peptidoglycan-binding protein [Pyrinomonadaceae bacterium]MDW8304156.1 peptidoglycan-binding domain-containing protein [Acidobacteriota bacterium]